MAPGNFSKRFHGRIEFLREEGAFVIFHPLASDVPPGRLRFTIAHELGHYFLEEHRNLIVAGKVHNSVESFSPVRKRTEREADSFAAKLLMPAKRVFELCGSKGYLDTAGVRRLAVDCEVTLSAAAFRYTELVDEPCVLVFADSGKIRSVFYSDEARDLGFGVLEAHDVPDEAVARKCIREDGYKQCGRETDTTIWFSPRQAFARLWEDSMRIGASSRTFTILSWLDRNDED